MKTLFFIFTFFLVPFFISAQSGCNSDFNYTSGNCPVVQFIDNSSGSPQPFGGEADIVNRIWAFGDGSNSNSMNPSHQYQTNGSYFVCLTIIDASGCSDQFCTTIQITCIQQCEAMFQYSSVQCPTVVFADNSIAGSGAQIVSWSWDFGDGTTGTGYSPTHEYTANGTYLVCLTILTSDGCVSDDCALVNVNCIQQCEALFQYTTGLCPTIVFADNSIAGSGAQIVSWNWNFGDGTTGTGPSQTHEYTANGTYTVCLIIETSDGCTSDYCTTVEINCITQCEAFFQDTVASCPTAIFIDMSTAGPGAQIVSWNWDFGDGSSSIDSNPTHEYTANGAYTVCLIIETSDGCTSDYCTTVEINCIAQCEALFQYTTGLCPTIVFADNSIAGTGAQVVSWNWNFGDGTTGTGPSQTHEYTANGTYTVCLIIETSDGCTSDYCTTVEINCITQCEAGFQYSDDACPEIQFFDFSHAGTGGQIVSYSWDFGDGTSGTGENPTHEYQANGIYVVCLIIETIDSCVSDYCYTIEIDCLNGLEEADEQSFTIYPNPVSDYFTVDLLQSGSISYRIIGMNGVEYGHGDFISSASHTIDVRKLQQGIYLIEFEVNGKRNSERFIKM